jgi:hypothetical protein
MTPKYKNYTGYCPEKNWDGKNQRSIFIGRGKTPDDKVVDVYLRAPFDGLTYGTVVYSNEPGDYETFVVANMDEKTTKKILFKFLSFFLPTPRDVSMVPESLMKGVFKNDLDTLYYGLQ